MAMIGRISKKRVDNYAWGEKVTFLVNGKWISALVSKSNPPSEEMMGLLKNLQEGDEAQFEITESPNKTDPSKPPYLNITDIVKVTRVGGDTGEEMDYHVNAPAQEKKAPAQPDGRGETQGDTRVRSMALAYAKDLEIAVVGRTPEYNYGPQYIIDLAKRFEQYILTGE